MNKPKVDRRNFLIAFGLGGAGAMAAAMAAKHNGLAQPTESAAPARPGGYRVSAHIRKYYQTTRV